MTTQFDASLIHTDPVSETVAAEHRREVDNCMRMPGALANAKLHADREYERLVNACNRLVWGGTPADMRPPTAEETAQLLAYLKPEDAERLVRDARLAGEQRHLVTLLKNAEAQSVLRRRADDLEKLQRDAERLAWEEFEVIDAAEKYQRFQAWRASRRS